LLYFLRPNLYIWPLSVFLREVSIHVWREVCGEFNCKFITELEKFYG